MNTFVIAMVFWGDGTSGDRIKNLLFCWNQLKMFSLYANKNGVNIKPILFDFSFSKSIEASVHISDLPFSSYEYRRAYKINRVLDAIQDDSPTYFSVIDADVFIAERDYDLLLNYLKNISNSVFYVFRVSDVMDTNEVIFFESQRVAYNNIKYKYRRYLNDSPSLGGFFLFLILN